MPALDEAGTLREVVADHGAIARELGLSYEIVVLDDGSTDETPAILAELAASDARVRAMRHARNLGIGRSLLDLYRAARGRWIFFNSADGQIPAEELRRLWAARDGVALVMGWRRPRNDPPHRVLMSRAYAFALRLLFGTGAHDVDSVRLYDAAALRAAWPRTTSSFAEAEILMNLLADGNRATEVVIRHLPRRAGRPHGANWGIVSRALWDFARFAVAKRLRRW